jgi:hypothetical protein
MNPSLRQGKVLQCELKYCVFRQMIMHLTCRDSDIANALQMLLYNLTQYLHAKARERAGLANVRDTRMGVAGAQNAGIY